MKSIGGILLLLILVVAPGAAAGPRDETLSVLDRIPNNWPEVDLRAWVNDGSTKKFRLGDEIVFRVRVKRDCYVILVYVDSHGLTTIIFPHFGDMGNHLKAGVTASYPSEKDDFKFKIEPPLGQENVYVIATKSPVDRSAFSRSEAMGRTSLIRVEDSPLLAERLRTAILGTSYASQAAMVKLAHRVEGRSIETEYTVRDVVNYFTTRTRSIYRPKLDAHINFDLGSAVLTEQAIVNLDVWGEALNDPGLKDEHFVIGGHTCDIGSDDYNRVLSRRRAEAVKRYLTENFGVDSKRLSIEAYGESKPLEPNESEEARASNRRVEFEYVSQ